MKRLVKIAPVLCTLLLLALGAYMPHLASLVLDRRLEQAVTLREDAQVSLELSQAPDFFELLELFQRDHSLIELTEGSRMTATEAQSAAIAALLALKLDGMVLHDVPETTPVLLTSKGTPGLSGIFWRCIWTGDDQAVLWLDDQTGLMVGFQGQFDMTTFVTVKEYLTLNQELSREAAAKLQEYCELYYPSDGAEMTLNAEEKYACDYTLTLYREETADDSTLAATCDIPVRTRGEWLFFNLEQ